MIQISIQLDDETARQMKELAERWGLPEQRYNTAVVARCVERVYKQIFSEWPTIERAWIIKRSNATYDVGIDATGHSSRLLYIGKHEKEARRLATDCIGRHVEESALHSSAVLYHGDVIVD